MPTTGDAERYSQRSVTTEYNGVIQQQAVPVSQSLLHASSASLATPDEAQRVDAPPTTLRRQRRRRPVTRYLPISLAVLILTIFAALFAFHQLSGQNTPRPTNKIAATQTAAEQATISVSKAAAISYEATQTALLSEPYHITVPGPCNNDPGWSSEPSNALQCFPSSVKLAYTSQQPAYARIIFSVNAIYPVIKFQHLAIAITVLDLAVGSCIDTNIQGLATLFGICGDGTWILTGYHLNSTGTYHANNSNMHILQIRLDATSEQYFVDTTLINRVSHIQDVTYNGVAGFAYELYPKSFNPPHGGTVNLKDFTLTPLS